MAGKEVFNEEYGRYEQWFEDNRYAYLSELGAVRQFMPADGEGMEVGIGSGLFAGPLGIKKGVEPSGSMRRLAQERGLDAVEGVAEALPYEDAAFDLVLMVTTVCFVDDIRQAFKEAMRVLRPEGRILIGFVDKASPLGKVYQEKKDTSVFYKDATFYSAQEIIHHLEEAGFLELEAVQTLFGMPGDMERVQEAKEGFGEGGFVVIKGVRRGS